MKVIQSDKLITPRGPYVHGLLLDPGMNYLFVSGQIGFRANGTLGNGIAEQTEIVWDNITEVLRSGGMTIPDIVKVTSFLTSPANIPEFGRVRARYLGDHRPTSTLLVVAGLASPDLLVEVEAIAAK